MAFLSKSFENTFSIKGRASRSEIGGFILCFAIINGILNYLFLNKLSYIETDGSEFALITLIYIIVYGYCLINCITLTVRRFHDINCNGFWALLLFPLSTFLIIFLLCKRGNKGVNRFGNDPLEDGEVNNKIESKEISSKEGSKKGPWG